MAHASSLRGAGMLKEGMQTIENAHKLDVKIDLEKGNAEEQLREALTKNSVRVIDLFRSGVP